MNMHDGIKRAKRFEDFNAGGNAYGRPNMRGRRINEGTTGRLNSEEAHAYYNDANDIDYVIYSYATPIAWHTPRGWHIVSQKFSISTSRQQSACYALNY